MDTGFRLNQLSRKTLLAGVIVLVGTPAALFAVVYASDAPRWVAWWGSLTLLYYFVVGAYLHVRYGGIERGSSADEN